VPLLVLPPDTIDTDPPTLDAAEVPPPESCRLPPAVLVPKPATRLIAPGMLPVDAPAASTIEPELPDDDPPVLKRMPPDSPTESTLAVLTLMEPVGPLALLPLRTETDPPT